MKYSYFSSIFLFGITILGFINAVPDKIFCYYDAESPNYHIRSALDVLDPFLCSHLVYAHVGISSNGQIYPINDRLDYDFGQLLILKVVNKDLKILVSVGGWNQGVKNFSSVISNPVLREAFVNNAINFVKDNGLDGFDIDWEYPGDRGGLAADKQNFVVLLKELRSVFEKNYILSATVGSIASRRAQSYDVPALNKYLDYINIMAYSLNGPWNPVTGHPAPVYAGSADKNKELNVDKVIHGWISSGASNNKINLGIPFYGRSFTLKDPKNNYVGAAASGPGYVGSHSNITGEICYKEICNLIKSNDWHVVWDNEHKVPYAFSGNQWVGYENEPSLHEKVKLAINYELSGIMIYSIDGDDIYNDCNNGKLPLLKKVFTELYG